MAYAWRVWSSYGLGVCHWGRIKLLHPSWLGLQLGIVVFGSNGRTSMVIPRWCCLRSIGAVRSNGLCRDTMLQQSVTCWLWDYSITIWADSQASKVYTPLVYPVAEELHKLRGKRTFLRLIKLLTLKPSVIVHKVFCRTLEVASFWKDWLILAITNLQLYPAYLRPLYWTLNGGNQFG